MRVLILNYEYPPLGGGAANALYHLVREYESRETLSVTVITSSIGTDRVENVGDNITLRFLDIGKRGSLHYQSNRELLLYTWRALREAKRLMRFEQFDLVHAFFGIPGGLIAKRLPLPYIISLRGSDVPGYSSRYRMADALLFRRLSRGIWAQACAVIANSDGLRNLAYNTAPGQRIDVIPNGVDTDTFSPRPDTPRQKAPFKLLYVGRLIPRKGLAVLLRALTGVEGLSLTIVGAGPEQEALAATARKAGIPVAFTGEVDHQELPGIYRDHDAFVLPSRNEGMSNTLLEAMASGLPVVVNNVGGTTELVEDNGIVVPIDDEDKLRSAVTYLRDHPAEATRMGRKSREVAVGYSWSSVASRYLNHYRECAVRKETV